MAERAEQNWVEQAKRGEPTAVAELYRRCWRAARATAYGVTGNLSLAEDAASEAFWAAMIGLAKLRDPERFGPWLRTIVIRTARRLRKAASGSSGFDPAAQPDPEAAMPAQRLEQQELGELIEKKATHDAFTAQAKAGGCMSDALGLLWKQPEPLELRTIEDLLRCLSEQVVPGAPVQFRSYEEPRYRAALRMQLGDEPAAAALGGVLRPWSILPEGVWVASVTIHLEPWASIRSGDTIELAEGTPFPSFGRRGSGPA